MVAGNFFIAGKAVLYEQQRLHREFDPIHTHTEILLSGRRDRKWADQTRRDGFDGSRQRRHDQGYRSRQRQISIAKETWF